MSKNISRFRMALFLLVMTVLSSGIAAGKDIEGLVTSKTVKENGNNTFTITMETYTTGKIEGGEEMPCDVWVLMDQSSSMEKNFSGGTSGTTKQEALKKAACTFIDQISAKYSSKTDHRIAFCTFYGNNSTNPKAMNPIEGGWWHDASPSNASMMKSQINAMKLKSNQATYINEGMATTSTNVVSNGKINTGYSGSNTKRNTVVVVFTDGCPSGDGNQGAFNYSIANGAFNYVSSGVTWDKGALAMKRAGVTIFTVGIQPGADPNQYDLSIGTTPSTTEANAGPLCNRFLNYLSSNFTADNAPDMGITNNKVKSNYPRTNKDYYLTANNASDLENIFKKISERVVVPAISLDSKTVMQDKITPYFSLPANTSGISYYTSAYNGSGGWASRTAAAGLSATISGDILSVTGFDFDANCCTTEAKPDGSHGKKIIIEFIITPKSGFLGGNGVPTNIDSESGIITIDDGMIENYTTQYPSGKSGIDVNFANLVFRVPSTNANVYENGDYGPTIANMVEVSSDGGSTYKKFDVWVSGLSDWQKAYVKINTPVFNDNKVTIEFDPVNTGSVTKKTFSATATLNIYRPVLTFKDCTVASGTTVNTDFYKTNNYLSSKTVWKNGSTASTSVTMIGTVPTISLTYSPSSFTAPVGGMDQSVKVTVQTNGKTSSPTFVWEKDSTCPPSETAPSDAQFRIHCSPGVKDITISKTVSNANMKDNFVFTITGPNNYMARVIIAANSSVTIKNLQIGDYTVTEESWSWAYTSSKNSITQNIGTNTTFSFTNTPKTNVPIHDEAIKNNKIIK